MQKMTELNRKMEEEHKRKMDEHRRKMEEHDRKMEHERKMRKMEHERKIARHGRMWQRATDCFVGHIFNPQMTLSIKMYLTSYLLYS